MQLALLPCSQRVRRDMVLVSESRAGIRGTVGSNKGVGAPYSRERTMALGISVLPCSKRLGRVHGVVPGGAGWTWLLEPLRQQGDDTSR